MPPLETETPIEGATDAPVTDTSAVDTAATDTQVTDTPVDAEAAALAAFDTGVASVNTEKTDPEVTAADVAANAAAVKTGDPAQAAPPAAGGAPLAVDHAKKEPDAAKTEAKTDAAQPDPDVDAAVAELGLKGKAEQRFREMSGTIKSQAQEIEPLRTAAARSQQWEDLVTETKASPEQFGQAIGYLTYLNSGEPTKMGQAFDFLLGELQQLGKTIGREVPGLVDPIQDHPDLAQKVTYGELSRPDALEIARHRTAQVRNTEHANETAAQTRQRETFDRGMAAVADLSNRLKAEDPDFDRKLAFLAPAMDTIRRNVPPDQWVAQIEDVYKRIPALPAAPVAAAPTPSPARPPVGAMPLRPTGTGHGMQRSVKGLSELDAFNMGLENLGR